MQTRLNPVTVRYDEDEDFEDAPQPMKVSIAPMMLDSTQSLK